MKRLDVPRRNQVLGQLRLQAGPEVVQQHKVAVEDPRRHNYIGVYRPKWHAQPSRQYSAPTFRLAAWILVANQQRRLHFFQEHLERIVRRPPNYETHSALGRVRGYIPQPLLEKVIMPQVGIGIIRNHREVNENWQFKQVARLDGHIERWIVRDAHRPLHPINDAPAALPRRSTAAHDNARLAGQSGKLFRQL
jgi:hypothetical protein